jgi:hypothetical protein
VRHHRHFTLDEARAELPWAAGRLAALRDARQRLTDDEAREELAEGAPDIEYWHELDAGYAGRQKL